MMECFAFPFSVNVGNYWATQTLCNIHTHAHTHAHIESCWTIKPQWVTKTVRYGLIDASCSRLRNTWQVCDMHTTTLAAVATQKSKILIEASLFLITKEKNTNIHTFANQQMRCVCVCKRLEFVLWKKCMAKIFAIWKDRLCNGGSSAVVQSL